MNKYIIFLLFSFMITLNTSSFAYEDVEMTPEEAAKKTFSKVCGKKFNAVIKFKGVTISAKWPDGDGKPGDVDQLVVQAMEQCKAKEVTIQLALIAMKNAWFKTCKAETCNPGSTYSTNDYLAGAKTNCGGGEVTVSNAHNPNMFCVYSVRGGAVYPKPMQDKENERCYVGEDDSESPGYGGASVTMPAPHADAKYFLGLTCRPPGPHVPYTKLVDYENQDDEDSPKVAGPEEAEEPKKDGEEPKKDK